MASHLKGPLFVGGKMVNVPIDAGHVYYVCQTGQSYYDEIYAQMKGTYPDDDSYILHTTIQSALDATVADRNDYVIVLPDSDDYDITAALTLTKKGVHLIAAGGNSSGGYGATNAVRIHQTTAATAVMTISGQAVEVSGFFLKGVADTTVVEISASAHCCNIHDNFVAIATTAGSASAYGIHGTGESTNLLIHHNEVNIYYPTASQTVGGGILLYNGTRARINDNIICAGGWAQTMTVGISAGLGTMAIIKDNVFMAPAAGTPASSTITTPIVLNASSIAVTNYISIAGSPSELITGGTAGADAVGNLTPTMVAPDTPYVTGQTYWVIKATEAHYADFIATHQRTYRDGTQAVHIVASGAHADIAIQAALDACLDSRGDQVIIMPSSGDYDLYAELAMSKKAVRLWCPIAIGYEYGCPNSARFHQNTTDLSCIAISAPDVEVAGFYFKNYAGFQGIEAAAGSYSLYLHHNSFAVTGNGTTGNLPIIHLNGTAGGYGEISRNSFFGYTSGASTWATYAITAGTGAVALRIQHNDVTVSNGNIATIAIGSGGQAGSIDFNNIRVSAANLSQGTSAGTITNAISMQTCMTAIGNRCCVPNTQVFDATSGYVDQSMCDNRSGYNGGDVAEDMA